MHNDDEPRLGAALLAGARLATKYINKALLGDYTLLGAGKYLSFSINRV
jgi:hypothetical protein